MNPYVLILTEPFVALPLVVLLASVSLLFYAMFAPKEWKNYSQFLLLYEKNNMGEFLAIGTGVGLIASIIMFLAHSDAQLTKPQEGIYLYGAVFLVLLLFFMKASMAEKRDLVGLHKQKIQRLKGLMTQELAQWEEQFEFRGKSQITIQQFVSKLKTFEIQVEQERKIRKNKKNLYRSIERLEEIEEAHEQLLYGVEKFQKEIEKLYDRLYALHAVALEEKFETLKKQLLVVEESLAKDPYQADIYLKQIQQNQKSLV